MKDDLELKVIIYESIDHCIRKICPGLTELAVAKEGWWS